MKRFLHAAGLAVFVAVGLAACGKDDATISDPKPLPPDGTVAAEFRTDMTQYTIGGSAKVTMVNRSASRFTMGVCNDVLERESGAVWVEIPRPDVACIALALLIAPGDSATLPLDLRQASTPGTYRVRRQFSVEKGNASESTYRRTNIFTMVR